ncbi:alpha/beta fold hydrolase [Blattabacterium cuenoti]|uniref:alpha/beta fold hydrolase n=1 Tax=Blattabacterium cuenoti TaxID=1653831 RepID=UPI00163CD469|nr:alpha/beta fold hydrolase [Blattabacterium cuenoti]
MILYSKIFGNGLPILVFHGLFGNGDNWISFAKKFSKNYQVHLVDIRNHGNSFSSKEMNYDLISKDILKYINHYKLKNIIMLGHSMGGKAVMHFSLSYPLIPKKIIIVDISPRAYLLNNNKNIIQILKNVNFNIINTRKDLNNFLKPFIKDIKIRSFFSKSTFIKKNGKLAFRFFLFGIEKNYFHLIQEKINYSNTYNHPILFLRGKNSNYILNKDYSLIKKFFPKAEIIIIKKSSHWIHIDNPIDFYKVIDNFLTLNKI